MGDHHTVSCWKPSAEGSDIPSLEVYGGKDVEIHVIFRELQEPES